MEKNMGKIYLMGRQADSRVVKQAYPLFAEVYDFTSGQFMGKFNDTSPSGLAKKVSKQFPFMYPKEDRVESVSNKTLKQGIERFPVSTEELAEFHAALSKMYPIKCYE